MNDKNKEKLKEIFDEMNHFASETTDTVRVGESLGVMTFSGYCNCSICCGQWSGGPTAGGAMPKADHTLAVDAYNPTLPIGNPYHSKWEKMWWRTPVILTAMV